MLLLAEKSSYGYKLIEESRKFGLSSDFLERGIAYRILHKLETIGLVESKWHTSEKSGMPRRVYTITKKGIEYLKIWYTEIEDTLTYLNLLRNRIKKIMNAH